MRDSERVVPSLPIQLAQRDRLPEEGPGKREGQREPPPRDDTKSGFPLNGDNNDGESGQDKPLHLQPATGGSLGLDLATAVNVTLMDSKPVTVKTGVMGPVKIDNQPVGALLIGRSSATLNGALVLTGLIDKDFTGEILIMVSAMFPPLHIPKGTRLAQLVPLPHLTEKVPPLHSQPRRSRAFGSTGGMAMLTIGLKQRPRKTVDVAYGDETIRVEALLDTGADVSIISTQQWPPHWPARDTNTTISGVGGMTFAKRSPLLRITIGEKLVTCTVSVLPLPDGVHALIGRDILAQMGMVLTSDGYPL